VKRVLIESPFGSLVDGSRATPIEIEANRAYARFALADALRRGEAPFASHLLYPQVLMDAEPEERRLGMLAGFEWGRRADLVVVYHERGITPGMSEGIEHARAGGLPIVFRTLGGPDR
jgi:hypothetical protein